MSCELTDSEVAYIDQTIADLQAENAELRKHVRMPDEPLEIDEKDFYVRAFIKWATEEQPEVKRLEAENDKLRECLQDLAEHIREDDGFGLDYGWMLDRMRELGVDFDG